MGSQEHTKGHLYLPGGVEVGEASCREYAGTLKMVGISQANREGGKL